MTHRHYTCTFLYLAFAILSLTFAHAQYPERKTSDEKNIKNQKRNKQRKDSLIYLIKSLPDDTLKFEVYDELMSVLSQFQIDSAVDVAKSGYSLAAKLRNSKLKIRALWNISLCYGNTGSRDYQKSLQYAHEAVEMAKANDLYDELHNSYSRILNLYFYNGDFPNAMKIANEGLLLSEKHLDFKRVAKYHSLFGFIFLRQGNLNDAERNYEKYLALSKELGDSMATADGYNCLGDVLILRGNYQQSLKHHLTAWGIYSRNHAIVGNFFADRMAYTAFKLSNVYKIMGNYLTALKYSSKGFDFISKHGVNEYDLVAYFFNTSEIYMQIGDYKKSLEMLYSGSSLSRKIKHKENTRDSYLMMANNYQRLKKYDSAYHYQILYGALKDSIVNQKSLTEIQQIHAKYNLEKKDQAIASQQAELEWQQVQRNAMVAMFGVLSVIGFLGYKWYSLKQKNNFQRLLNQKQNEHFNAILSTQDKERKRISQDLHDSLGSILSAAKLKLSDIDIDKRALTEDEIESFRTSVSLLDKAVIELRNVSHNIMPATLSKIGLVAALRNVFETMHSPGSLNINFIPNKFNARLNEKTEISLYMVLLELVNNVIKHSQAKEVTVQIVEYPNYLNIVIEDDGIGFDPERRNNKEGIGFKNILSRIDYLKGAVDIESAPGRGTSIIINIPI